MTNDFGVTIMARKKKRRKGKYLKGVGCYVEVHKTTRKAASRSMRYMGGISLMASPLQGRSHEEGKKAVASNRCGNGCGRRSVIGDYLCGRCRI